MVKNMRVAARRDIECHGKEHDSARKKDGRT
jgi:hypothetical protein